MNTSKPFPPPLPAVNTSALITSVFEIDLTKPVTVGDCTDILRSCGVETWFQSQEEYVHASNLAGSLEVIENTPENLVLITEAQTAREVALKEMNDSTTGLRGKKTSILLAFKYGIDKIFKETKESLTAQIEDLGKRKAKLLEEANDTYVTGLKAGSIPSPPPKVLGGKKITYVPAFDKENSDMGLMLQNLPDEVFLINEEEMADYIAAKGFCVGSDEALKVGVAIKTKIKERKESRKRK